MFAVFLPALNFRGNRSPYLWWFYKLLSEMGDQAGYICGEEYFIDPARLLTAGRPEAGDSLARLYEYRLPDRVILDSLLRADIPTDAWQSMEAGFPDNPQAAFRHYCLEEDAGLREAIANALDAFTARVGAPEVVITCVNCATLTGICRDRDIPLLHLELGPLRPPAFLRTVYFDFSGVNGLTEAQHRFEACLAGPPDADVPPSIDALRRLFMMHRLGESSTPEVDLGIALQIEDDSNVLCYANGHSSLSLISHARCLLDERRITPPVLVRAHPGSFFAVRRLPPGLEKDPSPSSVDFALRCKRILTINSGLAVEALFLERAAVVHGDCPFSYCIDSETGHGDADAFAFFLLNYLVPWKLAFTPEYIRWRLGRPTEQEIRQHHQESYMQDKIRQLELRIAELEEQLAAIQTSVAWRLTYPLRAITGLIRRIAGKRPD